MPTFAGDLMRILAHGGMNMGTAALGQYLGNTLAGNRAEDLEILKEKFKTLANASPDAAQAIAGSIEESKPGSMALMPKVQGYAPPGLEPSAGEPNPLDKLLSIQTSPNVFQSLQGAVPITRGETTEPIPSTTFATAAPKLEQQVANEVAARSGSPLGTLSYLKRVEQPRGEFATLIELSKSPDPLVATAAQKKLNQPDAMMELRREIAAGTQANVQANAQATQQWRDFLKVHMTTQVNQIADDKERARQAAEIAKVTALEARINGTYDPKEKATFQAQANALIKGSTNPILKTYPLWTNDVTVPGTGYNIPVVGEIGGTKQKVPVGETPNVTPKSVGTTILWPQRALVNGKETIINSQEEYDKLIKGK